MAAAAPHPKPAAATGGVAVDVREVRRTFGAGRAAAIRALDGVTLGIGAGEAVAVSGPSGSGKSTLLHVLAGIEPADAGTVQVGERVVTALGRRELVAYRRSIGVVFQRFHLVPALSVLDNVLLPVLPYRTDFDAPARARDLLRRVGLERRERSLVVGMSGGEQQRVAIARALLNRPALVLADEPTGSLDSANGLRILELLLELRAALGVTLVLATHDPTVAERCDRTIQMVDGRVTADGRCDA